MSLYTCVSSRHPAGVVHIVAADGPTAPLCGVQRRTLATYITTGRTATCSGCLTAWREGER